MEISFTERRITVEEVGFCCCLFLMDGNKNSVWAFKFEMALRYPEENIE